VIDTRDGGIGTLRCDRNSLGGTFESPPGASASYRTIVETHATRFIDTAKEQRERQAAAAVAEAEQRRRDIQRARESAPTLSGRVERTPGHERGARPGRDGSNSASPTGQSRSRGSQSTARRSLTAQVDEIIKLDSKSWQFKTYQPGSVSNLETRPMDAGFIVKAQFRYRDGQSGWVSLRVEGDIITCVEYSDTFGMCRPLGTGLGAHIANALGPQSLGDMLREDAARCSRAQSEGRLAAC
jgi:hypothetical protein